MNWLASIGHRCHDDTDVTIARDAADCVTCCGLAGVRRPTRPLPRSGSCGSWCAIGPSWWRCARGSRRRCTPCWPRRACAWVCRTCSGCAGRRCWPVRRLARPTAPGSTALAPGAAKLHTVWISHRRQRGPGCGRLISRRADTIERRHTVPNSGGNAALRHSRLHIRPQPTNLLTRSPSFETKSPDYQ